MQDRSQERASLWPWLSNPKSLVVLIGLLVVMSWAGLPAQAGFVDKDVKIVAWEGTVPEFLRDNIATMEQTGFDGLFLHLHQNNQDWLNAFIFGWQFWGSTAWTLSAYQNDYNVRLATRFNRFRDNLQQIDAMPGNVDWFDDAGWSAILTNAQLLGTMVSFSPASAIVLDPEDYGTYRPFRYSTQPQHNDSDPTRNYAAYKIQAQLRGRQFMQAIYSAPTCPAALNILLTYGYYLARGDGGWNATGIYGLYPSFLDGMLEAVRTGDRIYEGWEQGYGYNTKSAFVNAYISVTEDLSTTGVPAEYRAHYRPGFGLWIDCNSKTMGWDPVNVNNNYFTPSQFFRSVQWAVEYADKYVWIYNEMAHWWDYPAGTTSNIPTDYKSALARVNRRGKLERFDATTKDLTTWQPYASTGDAGGRITQNYGLTINGATAPGAYVDYTTTAMTIMPGDVVSVDVTPSAVGTNGMAGLFLTNNSGGTGQGTTYDSKFFGLYWSDANNALYAYSSNGVWQQVSSGDHPLGTTYIYRIERTGSTTATVKVLNADGTVRGSLAVSGLPSFTSGPYISLVSNQATTKFENVWIRTTGPTFNPDGGTYAAAQTVTINGTSGTVIRYTTDGSEPTVNHGAVIAAGGRVLVDHTMFLNARAFGTGGPSDITSASYILPGFNGADHFDGTTLATAVWETHIDNSSASVTQNEVITVNGGPVSADYTTKTQTVAVGKAISVEVTPSAAGTQGTVGLFLTNNSAGTGQGTLSDSKFIGLYWGNSINALYAYTSTGTWQQVSSGDHPLGTTYIYRIERTGSTTTTAKVLNADGTVRSVLNLTGLPVFTSGPYISLVANQATARFDNVRIQNTADPQSISGATLSGTVSLGGFDGDITSVPVTVRLDNGAIRNETVCLDSAGAFTIRNLDSGSYTVWVKGGHWLGRLIAGVSISGNASLGTVNLPVNGDADGDNEITSSDLGIVLASQGALSGQETWDPVFDVDGNGQVASEDLSIVLSNLDAKGE